MARKYVERVNVCGRFKNKNLTYCFSIRPNYVIPFYTINTSNQIEYFCYLFIDAKKYKMILNDDQYNQLLSDLNTNES